MWITGGTFASRLAKFVLFYVLARRFGMERFGQLSYVYACVLMGSAVADFGVSLAAPPRLALARSADESGMVQGRYLTWKVALGMGAIVLWLVWSSLHGTAAVRMLLLLFTPCIVVNELTLEWVFRGRGELRPVAVSRMLSGVLLVAVGLFFGRSAGLHAFVPFAFVAAGVFLVAWQGAAAYGRGMWKRLVLFSAASRSEAGETFLYGFSMIVSRAYNQFSLILLAYVLGMVAAAHFKLVHMPFFFALACGKWMADSAIATFSRAVAGGRGGSKVLLQCGVQLALLSLAGAFLMATLVPFALSRIYSSYGSFWPLSAAMGALLPLATLSLFCRELLPALGRARAYLVITCLMVALQVTAIVTLAPRVGLMAVPLAYGAAELAGGCILFPLYVGAVRAAKMVPVPGE